VRLGFPYRAQSLQLCIRDEPEAGLNVYFDLPAGGQFECLGSDGCEIEARFDSGQVESLAADTPGDGSDDTIFLNDEASFVTSVLASKRLIVGITFYNAGDQQLSFDIAGLKWRRPSTEGASEAPPPPASTAPVAHSMAGVEIVNPDWLRRPSGEDMAQYYPERASRMGVSGHVTMKCAVNVNGTVSGCLLVTEVPSDQEFGSAALKLAKLFKMSPTTPSGLSVGGGTVNITMDFHPPTD
jgi:TonB family protein